MAQTIKNFDILDIHVGIFNYRNLKRIDWIFTGLALLLAVIGLVVLFSASRGITAGMPYYAKQAAFFFVGLVLALLIMCIDSRFLVSIAPVFYCGAVVILVGVILFGTTVKGGQRWLPIGPLHLQPSEQTKLIVVYTLAWYLALIKERVRSLPFFLLAFVIAGVPGALILKQPSLGTALALVPITIAMLWVAGCKWWHLLVVVLAGAAMAPVAYQKLEPYQQKRLLSFVDPEADPKGTGWQLRQSKITIGSGGFSGKGFRQGTQTMLDYLPEYHTDFIFSLLAEEHGFVGALVVLGLYLTFLLRGLKLALKASEMANALLAAGCVTILGFHIFVNIAITLGLMPVTGIPLPFMSYGGNFYMTTMMCIGTLLHVPVRKQLFD